MSYGFVYILTNRSIPGLVKIGFTERSPHARCRALSSGTGVPTPYEVYAYVEVTDAQAAESCVHRSLAGKRNSKAREFFSIEPLNAWWQVTDFAADLIVQECPGQACQDDIAQMWRDINEFDEKAFKDRSVVPFPVKAVK